MSELSNKIKTIKLPEITAKGLVVFHSGSFGLRAALFKADKDYAGIKGFAESRQVDFTRAIADIIQQLKATHGSLPRACILISSNVVTAKLTLPVSPLRPKAYADMQELIKWEIDGALAEDSKQWLIGSMLVERGYLTNSQREELVTELELRQDQGGDAALIRFGDLAVELGYLTDAQLQECFALQNKFIDIDQDSIFGYQSEVSENVLDKQFSGLSDDVLASDSDNQSEHQWLVAGIGQALRKRWHGAFQLNGLKLKAFYPDNGASYASLGLRTDEDNQYLLEVHPSHLVFISGSNRNIKAIKTKARHDGNLTLDEVLAICPDDISHLSDHIYIYSPDDPLDELSFTLSEHLGIEVRPLIQGKPDFNLPEGFASNFLLPFIGTANHYLRFSEQGRACFVLAKDKEPPIWQKLMQPKVLASTTAAMVFIGAFGFIGWMYYNLELQTQRLQSLENKWQKENKVKKQMAAVQTEFKQLAADIDSIQNEITLNNKLIAHLNNSIVPAIYTVPGAVAAIANSANQGVLIEKVDLQLDSIVIEGRALKTRHANKFANELNKSLKPWRYQVGNTESNLSDEFTKDGVYLDYKMRLEIVKRYFVEEPIQQVVKAKNDNASHKGKE